MTTFRRPGRSRTETRQGDTQETVPRVSAAGPSQGAKAPAGGREPHAVGERGGDMPHERDESSDSQAQGQASADVIGRAAHADQTRGLTDTSRAAESDATYHRLREAPTEQLLRPSGPSGRRASRR